MNRKTLFLLFLTVIIMLVVNIVLMVLYRGRNTQNYLAAFIDKERQLQVTDSPKVILVGGSNAAFGFRSPLIAERLGMPVVNMGLQGSIGIRFYLNAIRPYVGQGDIIVISPEYHNFTIGFSGPDTLLQLLLIDPTGVKNLSTLEEVARMIQVLPVVHTTAVKNMLLDYMYRCSNCFKEEDIYFRGAFDRNGDYKFGSVVPDFTPTPFAIDVDNSRRNYMDQVRAFNDFAQFAHARGAEVFLTFPPTTAVGDEQTKSYLTELENTLKNKLTFPVVGSVSDSQYEDQFIYNTNYHLNEAGAVLHTLRFLDELCATALSLPCRE